METATITEQSEVEAYAGMRAVVAWEMVWRVCPGCGESSPRPGGGVPCRMNNGSIEVYQSMHGCGEWWAPEWSATVLEDGDDVEGVAARLVVQVAGLVATASATAREIAHLRLVGALSTAARTGVATGDEMSPGTWHNGDEWEAWCWDPAEDGGTLIVTESDR